MTKIEEKIIKLLELAKSPNPNEALQAALKAQELMAKYNVQLSNLKHTKVEPIECHTESYGKSYRFALAKIIADNFGVKHYYLGKMQVVFFGIPSNAEVAAKTYDYLHNMIHRMADSHQTKVYKQAGTTKGVYNSYVNGFLAGLKQSLDEQCKALKIDVSPEVEQQYEELSKTFTSFKSKGCTVSSLCVNSFTQGENDGKSAGLKTNKQLE